MSKEILFRDVLLRRASVLESERIQRLQALPQRGGTKTRTAALVRAFVLPLVPYARQSEGFRNYLTLIAQVASSRLHALLLVKDTYNPLAQRFIRALSSIHPCASKQALNHGYVFMLSTTMYGFSNNSRLDSLSRGRLRSDDFEAIAQSLVTFISSGLCALCEAAPGRLRLDRKAAAQVQGNPQRQA